MSLQTAILQLRGLFCFSKSSLHSLNKEHRTCGTDFTPYSEERPRKSLAPPQMYATKREERAPESLFYKYALLWGAFILLMHLFLNRLVLQKSKYLPRLSWWLIFSGLDLFTKERNWKENKSICRPIFKGLVLKNKEPVFNTLAKVKNGNNTFLSFSPLLNLFPSPISVSSTKPIHNKPYCIIA